MSIEKRSTRKELPTMDTTKTNGTAQHKKRVGTRTNLLKFMLFSFCTACYHNVSITWNRCCRDVPNLPYPRFLATRELGRRDATCSSTVGTRYSDCTLVLTFLESLLVAVRFSDAPTHDRRIDCTRIKISYIPAEKTRQLC